MSFKYHIQVRLENLTNVIVWVFYSISNVYHTRLKTRNCYLKCVCCISISVATTARMSGEILFSYKGQTHKYKTSTNQSSFPNKSMSEASCLDLSTILSVTSFSWEKPLYTCFICSLTIENWFAESIGTKS